jgi:hypothetical protein
MMASYVEREVKATMRKVTIREYVGESPTGEDNVLASAFRSGDWVSGIDLGSTHCGYEGASNWETRVENLSTLGRLICSRE